MVYAIFYVLFVVAALSLISFPILLLALIAHVCAPNESLAIAIAAIAFAYCCMGREGR